jgi:phage terminase large subunit
VNGFKDKPLEFAKLLWPHGFTQTPQGDPIWLYREQRRILQSIVENDETIVPAGNMLGKDFVGGFVAVWFFMTRTPCRIITTSVKDDHLRVLWGEIGRFIQSSKYPLTHDKGGPLIVNHRDIRKIVDLKSGIPCQISYLRGMVSEKGEGMAGHHAAHTLCIIDEASGVDDLVYNQQGTWSQKLLAIGNPNPCANWFKKAVKDGDLLAVGSK